MNISYWFFRLWLFVSYPFRTTYTASVCGHQTKLVGVINDGKEDCLMRMQVAESERPEYCLKCVGEMSIQCAWCGEPIVIGEPITLYVPRDGTGIPAPARVVPYIENGQMAYVGCLGWGCADSGADVCGRWMPPGKVERVPSPIEMMLASHANGRPCAIVVPNISRYPEGVTLTPSERRGVATRQ